MKVVRTRVEQWQRRGAPLRMLSRTETADLLGTEAYLAGMIDERGGNLHPLNYALGLAGAAKKAGRGDPRPFPCHPDRAGGRRARPPRR